MKGLVVNRKQSGKNLKEYFNRKLGLKNKEMLDILTEYNSPSEISMIYNGTRSLKDNEVELLHEKYGLRYAYLTGRESEYPTEEDLFKGLDQKQTKEIMLVLSYLRSIGFTIEINTKQKFYSSIDEIPEDEKEDLKDSLNCKDDNSLEKILHNTDGYIYELAPDTLAKQILDDNLHGKNIDHYVFIVSYHSNEGILSCDDFIKFYESIERSAGFIFETFFCSPA